MGLYFKNTSYKERALEDARIEVARRNTVTTDDISSRHTVIDAFFLLIKDESEENLSNLCELMRKYYMQDGIELTVEECYRLTQGDDIPGKIMLSKEMKNDIYHIAWGCLKDNIPLGSKTIMNGTINTSDWIGHCMWEGRLAGRFAEAMRLDVHKAIRYGLLHDYGRKFSHGADHITKGYEALSDIGWNEEGIGCLTHSFLNGGRCSWNDLPVDGFFVDEAGRAHFEEGCEKDDITIFLENYQYSEYDDILNIADLMATSRGIVSPAERIEDIATRRKFDPRNRGYFLAEFTNQLVKMAAKMGWEVPEELQPKVYAAKGITLEEITARFQKVSEFFYSEFSV